ncbi:MAG TPA: hypothetical protein VHC86_06880 [Opitutaceae bacterium]|nr:hypothetical protein [Opitutaceae bacterium]
MSAPPARPRGHRWPAEFVRLGLLLAVVAACTRVLFTGRFVGGVDARWYAAMLQDFLAQVHRGHVPVFVGQGPEGWNGGIHPFRSAPMFLWVAGLWDLLTWHRLGLFALQHLSAITAAAAGALGFYAGAAALLPRRRWEAMLLAILYLSAPAWLSIVYGADAYMTFMALGALPLALYGNARSLLWPDGGGYPQLAGGLVLLWMCHPPVALLATLATLVLQGGLFLAAPGSSRRRRAAFAAGLLFLGLGAYYFASMSGLPPRSGSLPRDALQLAGLALALAGLGFGILRRRGRWLACWLPAALLLAGTSRPWLVWMGTTAGIAALAAAFARGILRRDPGRRVLEILLPSILLGAGLAQACLGSARPERNLASLAGLAENASRTADFFLPVLTRLNVPSNYQPGAGLWALLLVLGLNFFRGRALAPKLFFAAGLLPVFALVRVPWVSDFLIGYFPGTLAGIVNFPLVLRLVPVLAAFIAMGGVAWLAAEPPGAFGRAGRILFLAVAAGWSVSQAQVLVRTARSLVTTAQATNDALRPENLATQHFDYDLLPIPSYFGEGVVDPRLEFRLRDAAGRVLGGPDAIARRMEAAGSRRLRLVAHRPPGEGPEWLELEPGLTVGPGEHLLLRFEFAPGHDDTGWLLFESEHGSRGYHLPDAGLAHGFGVAAERSHVIALWNSGKDPEHYRLRMSREGPNDLGPGMAFAEVVVSTYRDELNPIRLASFDPLRLQVDMPAAGWLETTRVFLPGYAAWLDGRRVPVKDSPEKLAMVAVPAGRHSLELRFRGTPRLWLAAVVSLATWFGWLRGLARRRAAPDPLGPAEEAGGDLRSSPPEPGWRLWAYRGGLALAFAAVLLFYGWTVSTSGTAFGFSNEPNQYYNQLAAGFRSGHLYMAAPVDPGLLALPESRRPGNAPYLLDASLYRGHYYLYFGVVPAALVFWPYAALTGHYLSEGVVAWLFTSLGFAFACAWWLDLRQRLFPALAGRWAVAGVLAIGFCTAAASALRRPMFYEVAIASGYAFTLLALWAVTRAWFSPRRSRRWLALAGVAAGLAVGSRANLAPAELLLLLLGSLSLARKAGAGRRRRIFFSSLLVSAAGCGTIGAGLAAYNLARFGSPFEFGHRYQLGMNPRQVFHLANFWQNLRIYYLLPPALNGYFPFVGPARPPAPPPDYIGHEHAHGEWIWLPLVALALLSLGAFRRRLPAGWGWIAAGPALLFLVNFAIVGSVGFRANRYMLDFQPALVLATLAALAPALAGGGAGRSAARAIASLGIAAAVAFNVFASMQVQGFFALVKPGTYAAVAGAANRAVWPWLRGEAAAVGDREIGVHWPGTEAGLGSVWQPLLATGMPGFDDVLWIQYDGGTQGQFVYQHGEYGAVFGGWFPLPVAGQSRLRISGGFLLPGPGHPWYGDRPTDEQEVLKRRLRVEVDGRLRFDRDVPSYDSSPRLQHWGAWRAADTALTYRFTGRLGPAEVLPADDRAAREALQARGAVRIRLTLPRDRYGVTEPLLQSGPSDAFDTIAVEFVGPNKIRLIHDSLGSGADASAVFATDYGVPHCVEIEAPFANDGPAWPAAEFERGAPAERVRVRWDGRDVFVSKIPVHSAGPASLAVGGSIRSSSQTRLMYSGFIAEEPRLKPLGVIGSGRMEGRLPSAEPLEFDRGVLVRFERRDGESTQILWRQSSTGLRFGWLDEGTTVWSEPVPSGSDFGAIRISISQPAADVALPAEVEKDEMIEIAVGGRSLLSATTDFFSAGPVRGSAIFPGVWSGSALGAAGGTEAEPPPPPSLPGRIRMVFRLPPTFLGGQPLLEAGRPVAADSIYLRQLGPDRYLIGLDHWLAATHETVPLELSSRTSHTLLIEMGSLFSQPVIPKDLVRLTLDGKVVLAARIPLYPVKPGEVFVGRNPLGMSTSDSQFRGEMISVRTRQAAPAH